MGVLQGSACSFLVLVEPFWQQFREFTFSIHPFDQHRLAD